MVSVISDISDSYSKNNDCSFTYSVPVVMCVISALCIKNIINTAFCTILYFSRYAHNSLVMSDLFVIFSLPVFTKKHIPLKILIISA